MAIDDDASRITADILKVCKNGSNNRENASVTRSANKNYSRDRRQGVLAIY